MATHVLVYFTNASARYGPFAIPRVTTHSVVDGVLELYIGTTKVASYAPGIWDSVELKGD
jgi:hypothetical protein